jgi:hypothetical protein
MPMKTSVTLEDCNDYIDILSNVTGFGFASQCLIILIVFRYMILPNSISNNIIKVVRNIIRTFRFII